MLRKARWIPEMYILILFQLVSSSAQPVTAEQPVTAARRTEQPVTSARTTYHTCQSVTSTSMTSTPRKNGIAMIIITGLNIFEF